jgi:hypothetical protein
VWHVHGSWTNAFVQGPHDYLLPVTPSRGNEGLGRARTWDWPAAAREVPVDRLGEEPLDVVVLQRPEELDWCRRWTGLEPGVDLPAVYVEHNAPRGPAVETPHPVGTPQWRARGIRLVHVTHFNAMAWDNGGAQVTVVEHGIPDPGLRWTGTDPSLAAVVNEPVRRWRVAGTDLLLDVARAVPTHVYGMGMPPLRVAAGRAGVRFAGLHDDLPQVRLHEVLGTHRAYLHPYRWTSLGLALLEAMVLGMPVLALATTEAPRAVPPEAGLVTCDVAALHERAQRWLADHAAAREAGLAARAHVLGHYGLQRFLDDWDELLKEVAS